MMTHSPLRSVENLIFNVMRLLIRPPSRSLELAPLFAHSSLVFHRVSRRQGRKLALGERQRIDEGCLQPLLGLGLRLDLASIEIELLDYLLGRALGRKQREPGRHLETREDFL